MGSAPCSWAELCSLPSRVELLPLPFGLDASLFLTSVTPFILGWSQWPWMGQGSHTGHSGCWCSPPSQSPSWPGMAFLSCVRQRGITTWTAPDLASQPVDSWKIPQPFGSAESCGPSAEKGLKRARKQDPHTQDLTDSPSRETQSGPGDSVLS